MNYCDTCHQEFGVGKNKIPLLACPRCTAAKGYQDLLDYQRHSIEQMLKGDRLLTLTKSAPEIRWHLVLAGYAQAWCGQTTHERWKKQALCYPKIDTVVTPVCESCLRVFEELAQDQRTGVA